MAKLLDKTAAQAQLLGYHKQQCVYRLRLTLCNATNSICTRRTFGWPDRSTATQEPRHIVHSLKPDVEPSSAQNVKGGWKVGDVVDGVVTSVKPYGAFVDIGGSVSLLHITEISKRKVQDVNDVFKEGDRVKVLIKKHDIDSGRIDLSTKSLEAQPGDMLRDPQLVWDNAEKAAAVSQIKVGDVVDGIVTSVKPFGAFVDIGGKQGLLHISQISSQRVDNVATVFKKGDKVKVLVMDEDAENGRFELSTRKLEAQPGDMLRDKQLVWGNADRIIAASRIIVNSVVDGVVSSVEGDGVLVDIGGCTGRLGIRDISHEKVANINDVFKKGDKIKAFVLDRGSYRTHVKLSTKKLEAQPGDMLRNPQLVWDNAEVAAANKAAEMEVREQLRRFSRENPNLDRSTLPQVGDLVDGTVVSIMPFGAVVDIGGGVLGLLNSRNISQQDVKDVSSVFKEGDRVKALVLNHWRYLSLTTRDLEGQPGDMLHNPQLVWDNAEKVAAEKHMIKEQRRLERKKQKESVAEPEDGN